ncbi:MAG: TetR/AcrR family transcriptional regulator [Pseudomonadota bacterium]
MAFSAKELQILDCAQRLLAEAGDAGLTMRRIADCAEMRLSNVQYYFKIRDDVLKAMVARYFDDCSAEIAQVLQQSQATTLRARLYFLARAGLRHGDEVTDMCRTFRELWAISSRNPEVQTHLMDYYRRFSQLVVGFVLQSDEEDARHLRLRSLLLPVFEGYSITAAALPLSEAQMADLITELALSVLEEEAANKE